MWEEHCDESDENLKEQKLQSFANWLNPKKA